MLWNALLMVLKIAFVIAITLAVGTVTQAVMNAVYYSMTGSPMPCISTALIYSYCPISYRPGESISPKHM